MLDIQSKEYKTMIEEMKTGGKSVKTPWGTANINSHGYYYISSKKEGFHNKLVHKLIWEEFYEKKIPNGYVIHHIYEKLDNAIQNLQCCEHSKHSFFHNKDKNNHQYDKPRLDKTKQKISESMKKKYARIVKQGFDNGKQRYALKFDGKVLKKSINPDKLLYWFIENYPFEIIKN